RRCRPVCLGEAAAEGGTRQDLHGQVFAFGKAGGGAEQSAQRVGVVVAGEREVFRPSQYQPSARRPVLGVEGEWWCGGVGGEGGAGPGRPDCLLDYSRRDGAGNPDVEADAVVVGAVLEGQVRLAADQAPPAGRGEADAAGPPGGGG